MPADAKVALLWHSQAPATFVNIVVRVLYEDMRKFLLVYLPLLFGFATAINTLMHQHDDWMTRWGMRATSHHQSATSSP